MSIPELRFNKSAVPEGLYFKNLPPEVFAPEWLERLPVIDSAPWLLARSHDPGFKGWILGCLEIDEARYDTLIESLTAYVQARPEEPEMMLAAG